MRLVTRAEDRAGIDLVAASDVGPLYVQVKSSNDGRRRYEQRGRRRFMVEVVVAPVRCPGLYRARLLDALADLRRRVQAKRGERGGSAPFLCCWPGAAARRPSRGDARPREDTAYARLLVADGPAPSARVSRGTGRPEAARGVLLRAGLSW